ncbi:MAG: fibronectin type III-like domain-contianing protein [Clostridia bacterium]|nr:fibronectin type III-like domain-contianing protein [Clostridia bacterium]
MDFSEGKDIVKCSVNVKNVGDKDGREVVQIYVQCPQGKLGKAARSLVAFKKTKLLKAGESQTLDFECDFYSFASYDDTGAGGNKNSYILEKGEYKFFVGDSVRTDYCVGKFALSEDKDIKTLQSICAVQNSFERIRAIEKDGQIVLGKESVPVGDVDLAKRILDNLPQEIGYQGDKGYKFDDVIAGKIDMDAFISQLTDKELEALTRGIGYMRVAVEPFGNAGVYGGIIPSLQEKGVPMIITADGPAGIRIAKFTSLLPCGTALASTWDVELVEELYNLVGKEMAYYGADVLLGAGMNIHRNPLCGRNFEYFSEDPLLSGRMASAFVNGVQAHGKGACPKHFACNNQEYNRNYNDSRISERALREIYLKGFEICVKESRPLNIMTSYNKINGVWSHYNYDLATTALRSEWNYDGLVITDWWMRRSKSPEFPKIQDNAYRVRAQVDVFMPGDNNHNAKKYKSDGTLLPTLGKEGGITRAELERTAKNTLAIALRIKK